MFKNLLKSKNGSILVYVLFLFASIMIIIATLLAFTYQNYNGVITQQLNARAYYLALEASDIVSAALLSEPTGGKSLLKQYYENFESDPDEERIIDNDSITHTSEGEYLGTSRVMLVFEKDEVLSTEKKSEYWAAVYIKTSVPDYRVNVKDQSDSGTEYSLNYLLRIFVSDPNKRTFDIIIEDKTIIPDD